MKHSVRISKIVKRETPKGMRKIVVDEKTYFYKVWKWGEEVTILDSDKKPFKEVYIGSDCTWRPAHIAYEIKKQS